MGHTDPARPSLIFIFDSVRLRSHLFYRYLSTSPNVHPIYHPWIHAAMFGPERVNKALDLEGQEDHPTDPMYGHTTFDSCTTAFNQAVADAESHHRIPMANEHWFNLLKTDVIADIVRGDQSSNPLDPARNPTHIPDSHFATLTPVILIRNPIYTINSIYRTNETLAFTSVGTETMNMISSARPLRLIFDYFRARKGIQPIVVDGDDVVWRTSALSHGLCDSLGLGKLQETWTPTPREQVEALHPFIRVTTKDMHDSSGIHRREGEEAKVPVLEDYVQQWTERYGEGAAAQLRELVEVNMPHYEYLSQFKL